MIWQGFESSGEANSSSDTRLACRLKSVKLTPP
jgi:hypothetical protein